MIVGVGVSSAPYRIDAAPETPGVPMRGPRPHVVCGTCGQRARSGGLRPGGYLLMPCGHVSEVELVEVDR